MMRSQQGPRAPAATTPGIDGEPAAVGKPGAQQCPQRASRASVPRDSVVDRVPGQLFRASSEACACDVRPRWAVQ
eukprot:11933425-Alexandrium_andersonii.AAC.1